MSGVINYTRVNFKDYPDKTTPITAANLNKLDKGVYDLDLALKNTNDLLGTASQASGVTGATAFAKINKINSDLTNVKNRLTNQLIVDSTVILDTTFNNTDYQTFATSLSKSGYVPIAITGWNCNRTVHNLSSLYIDTDNKIKGTIATTDGNALGVTKLEVYVLYLKAV